MKRVKTSSFVLTLPLRCELWQRDCLDKVFRISGMLSNNLIADRAKALKQLERTKAWKDVQSRLSVVYAQRDKDLEGKSDTEKEKVMKHYQPILAPLYEERKVLIIPYGFTEYAFHAKIQKWRKHYKKIVNTHVAQKLASSVWQKFNAYFYGNGAEIQFSKWPNFLTIEGKNNETGIKYADGFVHVGKLKIPVNMARPPKDGQWPSPSYQYEQEALSNRVKFCRITRRSYPEGWRYFVQLVLEGVSPIKVRPDTGEVLHPIGSGRVGHDIGTQTLAYCSNSAVGLVELAAGAQDIQNELCRINRAMDRSRRAMNPLMFNPDGTVIHKDKLAAVCLDKRGRRKWVNSKHYNELAAYRRYLYQKQARLRLQQHQELANKLLALGDEHYIETMQFKALAKKAKKQEPEPGEKQKRRKRFGKSIANKAPATFVNILEQKVTAAGGTFNYINTWQAKASQYNHLNHEYNKKKLSQRWNLMPDGHRVQRDLYSAFLLQHTNQTLDGFIQDLCDKDYPHFLVLHDQEITQIRGTNLPASAGV